MKYIEKLELQTEEVREVENLEKHTIINNNPFTVDEYVGHDNDFLAVDGEYDDGFVPLKETNGLGISCIVSKEVKEAREDINGVFHTKLKDRIDSEVNDIVRKQQLRELNLVTPVPPLNGVTSGIDSTSQLKILLEFAKLNNIKNLYLPKGEYEFNNVDISDFSCNFYGDGKETVITRNAESDYAINFIGTTELLGNVNSIENLNNAKIYINNTSSLKIGDVIKIISDDKIEGMKLSYDYMGEFKIVRRVYSNYIEVAGKLRYNYLTNIRIIKNSDITYNVNNIKITTNNIQADNRIASILKFQGGKHHNLSNIFIDNTTETGILLKNCYGYKIDNIDIGYLLNSSDSDVEGDRIGYGIVDTCSGYYNIGKINNKYSRHSFTTGSSQNIDDLDKYGISEYGNINTSLSNGSSSVGFDVHEQSYGIVFDNCNVYNGKSHGIQIRGVNNTIKNCNIVDNIGGLSILQGSGLKNLKNMYLINNIVKSNNLALNIKSDDITDDVPIMEGIEIRNCKFEGVATNILQKAKTKFYNCTFIIDSQFLFNIKGKLNSIELYNCDIVFNNSNIDNIKYLFNIENTSSLSIKMFNCKIFNNSTSSFEFKIINFVNTGYYYNSPIYAYDLYIDKTNITLNGSSDLKSRWTNKIDSGTLTIEIDLNSFGLN